MNSILLQLMALVYGTKGTVKTQPVTQRPISLSCIAIHESPEFFFSFASSSVEKRFHILHKSRKCFTCHLSLVEWPISGICAQQIFQWPPQLPKSMMNAKVSQRRFGITYLTLIFDVSFKLATLCWV